MFRKIPFVEGEFYHLYSRGLDKRTIFLDSRDRERFLKLLYLCNSTKPIIFKNIEKWSFEEIIGKFERGDPLTAIGAYCLMPNHFHILAHEIRKGGITQFMQKFLTAYSMYFNTKYERSGVLFGSRFQASHVNNDSYLQTLFAYIHLNPIKLIEPKWKEEGIEDLERAKRFLEDYSHSSYLDYMGVKRPENALISRDPEVFPDYFVNKREFSEFIHDWLSYEDGTLENTQNK